MPDTKPEHAWLREIEWLQKSEISALVSARFDPEVSGDDVDTNVVLPGSLAKAIAKRKAEFRAGRHAAALCMQHLGIEPKGIGRAAKGNPIWPAGVTGCITHSKGRVAVWMEVGDHTLGLDLEHLPSANAVKAIKEVTLTQSELDWVGALSEEEARRASVAIFSAKETLFKALYPRVNAYFGFLAACADPFEPKADSIKLHLEDTLSPEFRRGDSFEISLRTFEGFVLTRLSVPAAGS